MNIEQMPLSPKGEGARNAKRPFSK